ncbi:ABC transporter permease subunit [Brenneria corticis]|uniref:ABC transporter permease n=1 Tax=Brenneria corticis TaxID=2173106 RepID=UPI001FED926E
MLTLREREFILSARAIGVKDWRIILLQHLLPNLVGPVIVLMTLNIANNILLESSLTFLGLGVDPTIPSWGGMLADGRTYRRPLGGSAYFQGLPSCLRCSVSTCWETGCGMISIQPAEPQGNWT